MKTRSIEKAERLVRLAATTTSENEARNAAVEACKLIHNLGLAIVDPASQSEKAAEPKASPPVPDDMRRRRPKSDVRNSPEFRRKVEAGEVRVSGPGARHFQQATDRFVADVATTAGEFAKDYVSGTIEEFLGRGRKKR